MAAHGTVWKHIKTGGTYTVVGNCQLEATNRPAVLYVSTNGDGRTWARDLEEFMDGRFVRLQQLSE